MGGHVVARHNLGALDFNNAGNTDRVLKHWMVAAGFGYTRSLESIKTYVHETGRQRKMIIQKPCLHIRHTWLRSRVLKGMKLLKRLMTTKYY